MQVRHHAQPDPAVFRKPIVEIKDGKIVNEFPSIDAVYKICGGKKSVYGYIRKRIPYKGVLYIYKSDWELMNE